MTLLEHFLAWLDTNAERWENATGHAQVFKIRRGSLVYWHRSKRIGFWGLDGDIVKQLNDSGETWKVVLLSEQGNFAFVIDQDAFKSLEDSLTLSSRGYYLFHEKTELRDFEKFDTLNEISEEVTRVSGTSTFRLAAARSEEEVSEIAGSWSPSDVNRLISELDQKLGVPERESAMIDKLRRNHSLPALLRMRYEFKCQFCGFTFIKRDGGYYAEVAHIEALKDGGQDVSSNMLVLCPNHHKMLDQANVEVVSRSNRSIKVMINGMELEAKFKD